MPSRVGIFVLGTGSRDTAEAISTDKANAAVGAAGDEVVDAELLAAVADLPLPAVGAAVEDWRARNAPPNGASRTSVRRSTPRP